MTDPVPSILREYDPTHGMFGDIGGTFEEMTPDRVVVALDVDARHHQPFGLLHGGVHCVLVETAASAGAGLWAISKGNVAVVGVSNSTDFLRSHREGRIIAVATPIHRGRTQQLWQVVVSRESDGKTVARGQVRLQNIVDPAAISAMIEAPPE